MSVEVALRSLDVLLQALPTVNTLKLFGGEPLCNPRALATICEYARSNSSRDLLLGLSTNGTLLNAEIVDMLVENRVATSISLDGPRRVTERLRIDARSSGYYDEIIAGIELMASRTNGFAIEATYTGVHMELGISLLKLVRFLNSLSETVKVQPIMMPSMPRLSIVDLTKLKDYTVECVEEIFCALCSPQYFESSYLYENFVIRCLTNLMLGSPAPAEICQIGRNITVFPNGDLCPCYLFRNESMGNIVADVFPSTLYRDTRREIELQTRADNLASYSEFAFWYRPLIGDICFGELAHPNGNASQLSPISPHLDVFYDTLARTALRLYLSLDSDSPESSHLHSHLQHLYENLSSWMDPNA